MPLVKRKITHRSQTTWGSIEREIVMYVPPHRVNPRDTVIKTADISDAMLADLAETYPDEFGKAAAQRQLTVGMSPDAFAALPQPKALEIVKAAPESKLGAYFDTELSRIPTRPAVMKAFAARGVTPESHAAESVVDTSDLDDEDGEIGG